MSNYFRKLAASIALVGALATGGCGDNGNKNESDAGISDAIQCNTQESYNLNLALTDYETGNSIENAIVRAEWNENEGKVCPFNDESKLYTCNAVPGDLSLGISLEGISEIYNSPIDMCGEQSQTKEYWFNAPVSINPDIDAGSTGDVYDAGSTTDVYDAGNSDTSVDTEDDAGNSDTSVDAGVENDASNADTSVDAGLDTDADNADAGMGSDVGNSDAAEDAGIVYSCANLNEFPACMDTYTTLVGTGSGHLAATNLAYQNVTQDFADLANATKKVVSGNACNLPDYFQQPGSCIDGLVQGQASVNLVDDSTIEVKGFLFQERNVALEKLMNGELEGTSCTVVGIDPNTAQVNCQ